jgi:phosphoribosyl 1,2-cyclic phosphodiesterase
MLKNGRYPYHLKRRISGGLGHLSNKQALEVFLEHRPQFMSHLLLGHLSQDNNKPELVYELFNKHANGTEIVVASRYEETAVYHITGSRILEKMPLNAPDEKGQFQYSLF